MVMTKLLVLVLLTIMVTGCVKNPQLKAVVNDLGATPRCDIEPILTQPQDTKDTLNAKLLMSNYKRACMRDWYFYFDKKLDTYKQLF